MKHLKISLFLGIIIISGFFVESVLAADICLVGCDDTLTLNGKTCVDMTDGDLNNVNLSINGYRCVKDYQSGSCPTTCPVVATLPEDPPETTPVTLTGNCACTFVFDGKGCTINKEKIFPFGTGGGSSVLLRDMVDSASFASCPKEAFTSNFVDLDYSVNATEANCSKVHYRVANLAGYVSELDCIIKVEASNASSGTGLSSDIKTWIQFGEQIGKGEKNVNDTGTKQQTVSLVNPLGTTNLIEIFGKLIKAFVGLVGMIVLVVFVYGGFMWLLSAGNPEKIKKGTQAMMYALIGLFIIFSAYVIISTILKALV